MASTNATSTVIFKGTQTEILALVNPKAKWKDVQQTLLSQVATQHHIFPQLKLQIDFQNRVCGLKTLTKLEKDLRKIAGDKLGITNYRIRASRKETAASSETALVLVRDLADNETIQTTKDVMIVGSIPESARVETPRSCFVFGTIRGKVLAGSQGGVDAVIVCLETASGASLAIGKAAAVLHLAPSSMRPHYYIAHADQGQLRLDTRFLE